MTRLNPIPAIDAAPIFCARCAVELLPGAGDFFRITIEAVADPSPPILDDQESAGAIRRKIERLLAQLEDLSAQEALDQVYRRMTMHLCGRCYPTWIESPAG